MPLQLQRNMTPQSLPDSPEDKSIYSNILPPSYSSNDQVKDHIEKQPYHQDKPPRKSIFSRLASFFASKKQRLKAAWKATNDNPHAYTTHTLTTHAQHNSNIEEWVCCCGNENDLSQYDGYESLNQLKCQLCEHTFCLRCNASEFIQPEPPRSILRTHLHSLAGLYIGQMCSKCGWMHCGLMNDGKVEVDPDCHCGDRLNDTGIASDIDLNQNERQDSVIFEHELLLQHHQEVKPQRRLASPPTPVLKPIHHPGWKPCSLKRRNAVCVKEYRRRLSEHVRRRGVECESKFGYVEETKSTAC
jgi:hypothetical protein